MMLLAEALRCLLNLWDKGHLDSLPQNLIEVRIPIVLTQVLNRTLSTQDDDGSWVSDGSPEVNAYGILTLVAIQNLPHIRLLGPKIQSAIHAGRQALLQRETRWKQPQYIWIEKVTFGSCVLAEAYCLSAMYTSASRNDCSGKLEQLVSTQRPEDVKLWQFFKELPENSKVPGWKILASVIEGLSYFRPLKATRSDIFPHSSSRDNYLAFIPCTWIVINNCNGLFLEPALLWDMMVVSMLDYLVDEYMESVISNLTKSDLTLLQRRIETFCRASDARHHRTHCQVMSNGDVENSRNGNGYTHSLGDPVNNSSEPFSVVETVMGSYIGAMLGHPRIQGASAADQRWLQVELEAYLLAHIDQIRENGRLRAQKSGSSTTIVNFESPRTSHYEWSHTTAATHTSCALSFAFYICHLGSSSTRCADIFQTSYQKYMARDLCAHLAVLSRLYNDYGSVARDRAESNLNSVNFPEFHSHQLEANPDGHESTEEDLKNLLLGLAQYERSCAQKARKALMDDMRPSNGGGTRLMDAINLFVGTTELYADIYVARDITNRVR